MSHLERLANEDVPHERPLVEATDMLPCAFRDRVAGSDHENSHGLALVVWSHRCPHARCPLRVESGMNHFGVDRHFYHLRVDDFDGVFVDSFHSFLMVQRG